MSWLGAGIGFWIGHSIGGTFGGIVGGLIGAYLTSEKGDDTLSSSLGGGSSPRGPSRSGREDTGAMTKQQEMLFLAAAAAMLAKMAKADGHISSEEIASAEHAFERMGFTGEKRDYCVGIFRKAKDDSHSIYDYADDFARVQKRASIRIVFYDLLWELAAADGTVSSYEIEILRNLPAHLAVNPFRFVFQYNRYCASGSQSGSSSSSGGGRRPPPPPRRDELAEAYELLGCSPSATEDELKKAYRAKAKQYHPDEMVAKGLPPELVKKATEEMARINAAYDLIRKSRR